MNSGRLRDWQAAPRQSSQSQGKKVVRLQLEAGVSFLGQVFFEVGRWQFHLHLIPFRLFPFCCAKHLSQLGLI